MATTFETLAFTKTTTFEAGAYKVIFIPVSDMPSYSHKIVITKDGLKVAQEWLPSGQNVTAKNALFFYNKKINGVYPDGEIVKTD